MKKLPFEYYAVVIPGTLTPEMLFYIHERIKKEPFTRTQTATLVELCRDRADRIEEKENGNGKNEQM